MLWRLFFVFLCCGIRTGFYVLSEMDLCKWGMCDGSFKLYGGKLF